MDNKIYNYYKLYLTQGKLPELSRFAIRRLKLKMSDYSFHDENIYHGSKILIPESKLDITLMQDYNDLKTTANGQHSFYNRIHSNYEGITFNQVRDFLSRQKVYQLHKPSIKMKVVEPIVKNKPGIYIQVDTINLSEFAHPNNNYSYCLTCIDVFSKKAWAYPLKHLKAAEISKNFEEVIKECPELKTVQSDNGTEFQAEFANLLKSRNVKHNHSRSHTPQAQGQIERFNKTLKSMIYNYFTMYNTQIWVPVLKDIILNYNTRIHNTIKEKPQDVFDGNVNKDEVYRNIDLAAKGKITKKYFPKLNVGDKVRILKSSLDSEIRKAQHTGLGKLSKSYNQTWTSEVYVINNVSYTTIGGKKLLLYKINVDGLFTFRRDELQKVNEVESENLNKSNLEKYGITFKGFGRERK